MTCFFLLIEPTNELTTKHQLVWTLHTSSKRALYTNRLTGSSSFPFLFWYSKSKNRKWSTSIFQQITSGFVEASNRSIRRFFIDDRTVQTARPSRDQAQMIQLPKVSMATQMTPPHHPEHPEKCVLLSWKSIRITKAPPIKRVNEAVFLAGMYWSSK